jgi:hypothetical protein
MWGNDIHGDCVTAEEAFAKACNNPEIFISDAEVIAWATQHGVLEGAYLNDVLTWMQTDGFHDGAIVYDDGPHFSVNWTDTSTLQAAIARGPVKLGIAADQIETAWNSTGGQTGWFATGFHSDTNEDHCVSLCGYGSITWLAQQLGVSVPGGVDGTQPGYAMFTWDSIGIIDVPSMIAITQEAWLRQPTTVVPGQEFAIASVQFANVHLRMDGTGVTSMTPPGGGTVNCQFSVGPFEKFRIEKQTDGTVAIASVQFPNVHLRMDGTGVTSMTPPGGGTVNCQFGVGPFEKFRLEATS